MWKNIFKMLIIFWNNEYLILNGPPVIIDNSAYILLSYTIENIEIGCRKWLLTVKIVNGS